MGRRGAQGRVRRDPYRTGTQAQHAEPGTRLRGPRGTHHHQRRPDAALSPTPVRAARQADRHPRLRPRRPDHQQYLQSAGHHRRARHLHPVRPGRAQADRPFRPRAFSRPSRSSRRPAVGEQAGARPRHRQVVDPDDPAHRQAGWQLRRRGGDLHRPLLLHQPVQRYGDRSRRHHHHGRLRRHRACPSLRPGH
ncbi:hypothetical protein D3C81_1196470 [compost metagenome]